MKFAWDEFFFSEIWGTINKGVLATVLGFDLAIFGD